MAFVYKRGKIYYVGWNEYKLNEKGEKIRVPKARPISPDKKAAEEVCARMTLNNYADKNKTLKKNIPIQEFYEEYKESYAEKKKRPSTLNKDDTIWKTFKAVCPEIVLAEQFDNDALDAYMSRRKNDGSIGTNRKLKKSSINREVGMLKNMARWGYKNRYLAQNYYDLVDTYPETDSQEKKPYTDTQIQLIMDNTQYPQREAHILAIWHGLRSGEAAPLNCKDFVWKEEHPEIEIDYIKIRDKKQLNKFLKTEKSGRDVPIHPFWRAHLRKIWETQTKKSDYFLTTQSGEMLSTEGLSSYTRKLFKRLGFKPKEYSFHSGRHTYATRIKDGGGSLTIASKSLGHSNTRITEEVYTDFKPHEHFGVVDYIKINIKKPPTSL
ncbi:MAG: tyrosine-type recombinase/integrase [Endomicrobium sp.]|jgi:integrase|nr:tyrosine-type recombinase/integrase [Endomicrobium sp.]